LLNNRPKLCHTSRRRELTHPEEVSGARGFADDVGHRWRRRVKGRHQQIQGDTEKLRKHIHPLR
jgi:hypothetical protein